MGLGLDSLPSPLESGTAGSGYAFLLESIKHQGISAFNTAPSSYQSFHNVKDFNVRGDGTMDDTDSLSASSFLK
jgi:glucan 1,3-beta-glucosidase